MSGSDRPHPSGADPGLGSASRNSQPPVPPALPPGPPPTPPSPGVVPSAYPPPYWVPFYGTAPPRPTNGLGTAAGTLGIVATVLAVPPFLLWAFGASIPVAVVAIALGGVGISRAKRLGGAGKGMAVTGVVLGIVALSLTLLEFAAIYLLLGMVGHM
jgi:hypothetical protein